MHDLGNNPGEQAEAARKRRARAMIVVSVAIAALIVVGTAIFKRPDQQVAPGWAIAFAFIYVGAMVFGGWRACRQTDEVEARNNRAALVWAACFYGLTYPVWYFLWKGGLVPEPDHMLMFAATVFVAMATYLARRIS
jgi:hypothetical protein